MIQTPVFVCGETLPADSEKNLPVDMIDEDFYQQGMQCFRARLPRRLVRQALKAIATKTEGRGIPTTTRRLRCFAQGLAGLDAQGRRSLLVEEGFQWPEPPDASWKFVVLAFRDRGMEFDFVHPVSRRFYSEDCCDSDQLPAPPQPDVLRASWYGRMGFEVIHMTLETCGTSGARGKGYHLKLVRQ